MLMIKADLKFTKWIIRVIDKSMGKLIKNINQHFKYN